MTRVEIPFSKIGASLKCTNIMFEQAPNHVTGELQLMLTAYVATEKQRPFVYTTDRDWWQMFKRRFFPKWLIARFPIIVEKHEVSVKTVYPFLSTNIPPKIHGDRIMVMINDRPVGMFVNGTEAFTPMEEKRYQSTLFNQQREAFCFNCHKPLDQR